MRTTERLLAWLNAVPIGVRRVRVAGDWLYPDSLDRLAACLGWKLGWLEAGERHFIARYVQPGMRAVDVGANLGCHTLALARAVGSGGRVDALEPDPRNFRALTRALETAGCAQVALHEVAAAEASGTIELHLSASNRGDHRNAAGDTARERIEVRGVALDELLPASEPVDFVKLDVQGAEVGALHGLRRTLERSPQIAVLCEICPPLLAEAGADAEALFAPLRAARLEPHRIGRDGSIARVTPEEAWSRASAAGYENFVFRRA